MQWWVPLVVLANGGVVAVLASSDPLPMWLRLLCMGIGGGTGALLGFLGRAPGTAKVEK